MPPFTYASPDSGFWDTLVVLALGGEDPEQDTPPRAEAPETPAEPLPEPVRAAG